MAQIVINEISANYMWNVGTSSYATVALPITSQWGPGYFDPDAEFEGSDENIKVEQMLEKTAWSRFPATQEGLESFVATYRGPADVYRAAKDNSYQMAMTLLTAGYDVLVCRICPGAYAEGAMVQYSNASATTVNGTVTFRAKYPGTFGNNIMITATLQKYLDSTTREEKYYWNIITYVVDASGVRSSVENKAITFDINNESDTVMYYTEVESNFWEIKSVTGTIIEKKVTVGSAEEAPNPLVWRDPSVDYGTDESSDEYQKYMKFGIEQKTDPLKLVFPAVVGTDYNKSAITEAQYTAVATAKTTYETAVAAWIAAGSPTTGETKTAMDNALTALKTAANPVAKKFEDVMTPRFDWAKAYSLDDLGEYKYCELTSGSSTTPFGLVIASKSYATLNILYYQEWVRTHAVGLNVTGSDGKDLGGVYDILKDKLSYNPQRVISPGWDDQDYTLYVDSQAEINQYYGQIDTSCDFPVSPLHLKLMDVAYYSRCATGFIDVPKSIERKYVHIEDPSNLDREGYVQKLARIVPKNAMLETNGSLFTTHCGFFAPWGQYNYVGTAKMTEASPSFLALLIQRAQILNQPIQYEWALPTNRKHNLKLGKMEYTVPKKVLDQWQKLEGASVNVITNIPDLGTNIWGNSTLYEVPPATYQALANLSTRFLVNAVEDLVYKCGIAITFQYSNGEAFSAFYAGVSPLLDTMRNVGAIDAYKIQMSADINSEDRVNANTVLGKVYLVINGVINDIIVDIIALPPSTDLNAF